MAWSVDSAVQVQNLIASIKARLEASGWTLTDRDQDGVWHATNNQGVTQYIQIINCQSSGAAGSGANWCYLQFQGWLSWNVGTHAGASGSGTTYRRIYYAGANVAAATPVDLYMSVTANRFIMFIQGVGNYRNWMYFGGLDALAGVADPNCVLALSSYEVAMTASYGAILLPAAGGASYWTAIILLTMASYSTHDAVAMAVMSAQTLGPNATQMMIHPLLVADASPQFIRGNLDGLLYCPIGSGSIGHLDTITVGGVVYLVIVPGGGATQARPVTGNYAQGLAIVEA